MENAEEQPAVHGASFELHVKCDPTRFAEYRGPNLFDDSLVFNRNDCCPLLIDTSKTALASLLSEDGG